MGFLYYLRYAFLLTAPGVIGYIVMLAMCGQDSLVQVTVAYWPLYILSSCLYLLDPWGVARIVLEILAAIAALSFAVIIATNVGTNQWPSI